jgi:hypothetical protein
VDRYDIADVPLDKNFTGGLTGYPLRRDPGIGTPDPEYFWFLAEDEILEELDILVKVGLPEFHVSKKQLFNHGSQSCLVTCLLSGSWRITILP